MDYVKVMWICGRFIYGCLCVVFCVFFLCCIVFLMDVFESFIVVLYNGGDVIGWNLVGWGGNICLVYGLGGFRIEMGNIFVDIVFRWKDMMVGVCLYDIKKFEYK